MLFALGLNHKTAPVELRERLAVSDADRTPLLHTLISLPDVDEVALIATCNRTECFGSGGDHAIDAVSRALASHFNLGDEQSIERHGFVLRDRDAVRHAFRVASGLDSLILGEPQILGQMKAAFGAARAAGTTGWCLERLFQQSFAAAKRVRSATGIGENPVSVAFAAVRLAQRLYGDFSRRTALLIGAGETIELTLQHLLRYDIGHIIIANRTRARAEQLIEATGCAAQAEAIALPELPTRLADADIIISSTAAPLPILGKGAVERALKQRRRRPMFMVDIAVPRDIEPEVGDLEDVYLYTVDDLQDVIQENLDARRAAAADAELIIEEHLEAFERWRASREGVQRIQALRQAAASIRDRAIDEAAARLARGQDPQDVLRWLGHQLTNRLIHAPTVALRHAIERHDEPTAAALVSGWVGTDGRPSGSTSAADTAARPDPDDALLAQTTHSPAALSRRTDRQPRAWREHSARPETPPLADLRGGSPAARPASLPASRSVS